MVLNKATVIKVCALRTVTPKPNVVNMENLVPKIAQSTCVAHGMDTAERLRYESSETSEKDLDLLNTGIL